MQSVGAHQGKERRQKGTARRPGTDRKHVTELAHLEAQKRDSQNESDGHPKISGVSVRALHRQRTKTTGNARGQQAGGLYQYMRLVEQRGSAWAARGLPREHR